MGESKNSKGAHLSLLRQRQNMKGNISTDQRKNKTYIKKYAATLTHPFCDFKQRIDACVCRNTIDTFEQSLVRRAETFKMNKRDNIRHE